jgi:hypothetical protein
MLIQEFDIFVISQGTEQMKKILISPCFPW